MVASKSPFKFEKDHRQMGKHFRSLSKSGAVTLGAVARMMGVVCQQTAAPI
jgi:hypothetical protein